MIDLTNIQSAPEFVEYARARCRNCGDMPLSQEMYRAEMMRPDSCWSCPVCGQDADFDEDRWDELYQMPEDFE